MTTIRYATFAVLFAVSALPALAQFSADVKISGDAFRHHQTRTYQRHARDYSQMLYYHGRSQQPLNQQSAKQQVTGIRQNVQEANKAIDQLKESQKTKPEVAKSIDKIKERHAKVIAKCDEIDAHLSKSDKDAVVMICDCCFDAMEELDAAAAETDKLMKDLKLEELPKPAKSGKGAPQKK